MVAANASASASASATATAMAAKLRHSNSDHRRINPAKRLVGPTKMAIHYPLRFSSGRANGSFVVRALDPENQRRDQKDAKNNNTAFTSQEDLDYLWKLLAGSILGAVVIKYGSVVFPDITRPNLVLALIIISTPVIVAVLLLINQSRKDKPS